MTQPRVSLLVELDADEARKGFAELKNFGKASMADINAGVELVARGFGFVFGAIGTVIGSLDEYIAAAGEAERVERRLVAALQERGQYSDETMEAVGRLNGALQLQLGIDGELLTQMQGTFVAAGIGADQLDKVTKAAIGLSAATGKDLVGSAELAKKAFLGKYQALEKVGIVAKSATDAQRQLVGMFALAEAQSTTLATRITVANEAWGDLGETFGGVITSSGALKDGIDAVSFALTDLNAYLSDDQGKKDIDALFRGILGYAADTIEAFLGMRQAWLDFRATMQESVVEGVFGGDGDKAISTAIDENGNEIAGTQDRVDARSKTNPALEALQRMAERFRQTANAPIDVGDEDPKPDADAKSKSKGKSGGKDKAKSGGDPLDRLSYDADFILGGDPAAELQKESELEEKRLDRLDELRAMQLQIESDRAAQRVDIRLEEEARIAEINRRAADDLQNFYGDIATIGAGGIGDFVGQITAGLIAGEADIGGALKGLLGTMLGQLGQALIAMGTAAIAAGLLGTVSPIFGASLGGPAAVAAGAGLVIAGGALAGVGAAIGASGAASKGATSSAPTAPRIPRSTDLPRSGASANEGRTTVINVNFGSGVVYGTPAQIGRDLQRYLGEANRLRPSFAGGG